MSKVRMVIWSSYFMYPVRQSKVQGMPMARNSQNTILYLCSVGRRILRMHYLRYDEQDSRVVGGGVPDAKAEGVGGQEEEDNVEGEEGTDGDLLVEHLGAVVVEEAGPPAVLRPGQAKVYRRQLYLVVEVVLAMVVEVEEGVTRRESRVMRAGQPQA